MKKRIFAVVCVILCLAIIMPTVAFAYGGNLCEEMPTVYLIGQGTAVSNVAGDVSSGVIFPFNYDMKFIMSKAKNLLGTYISGVLTDNWDGYIDAICDTVIPIISTIKLDKNGDVVDGSGITNQNVGKVPNADKIKPQVTAVDKTSIRAYSFRYDWRLDPCEVAQMLDGFIKQVKEMTGFNKVNVCSRCLGVNIVLAYLEKYGVNDLNKCVMYSSGFDGIDTIGQIFSCEIVLDADTVEAFTDGYFSIDEHAGDPVSDLIKCSIALCNKLGILDVGMIPVQVVYDKIYEKLMPRLFLESFGTMPGFWCYVGDEYYSEAKSVIFGENNKEYEKLIEKIDCFHYNILNKSKQIIETAVNNGLDAYIITKYGLALTPVTAKSYGLQSDFLVGTSNSSLGATCTSLMEKFDDEYLENARKNETMKYIAPDLQIDASTCLLKDKTWFIKNIAHKTMPECVTPLMSAIIYHDGPMTVFDDEKFPQYMVVDDKSENMYLQTKENCDTQKKNAISFYGAVFGLSKSVCRIIIDAILGLFTK